MRAQIKEEVETFLEDTLSALVTNILRKLRVVKDHDGRDLERPAVPMPVHSNPLHIPTPQRH